MPNVTLNIPDERYSQFLRTAANFLEGRPLLSDTASETRLEGPLGWNVISAVPTDDDDFSLLVDYYRRLPATGRRILDYLVDHPDGAQAPELSFILGFETQYGLSGSVGHATKVAGEMGRPCPIQIDKQDGRYWVPAELIDAVRQARLWSVEKPFRHSFTGPDGEERTEVRGSPARYVLWEVHEDATRFFATRDELLSSEPEAFDEASYVVIEFAPDHHVGELADRTTLSDVATPTQGGE